MDTTTEGIMYRLLTGLPLKPVAVLTVMASATAELKSSDIATVALASERILGAVPYLTGGILPVV